MLAVCIVTHIYSWNPIYVLHITMYKMMHFISRDRTFSPSVSLFQMQMHCFNLQ